MLHKKGNNHSIKGFVLAFTLVELIVVVTILAILATIGFVSYSSYLTGVRDTNRLAQLVSIHDGLTLYSTTKDLPLPDDNVQVKIGTETIAYQGYAGSNTLETIDFTKGGKDPRDGEYFSYYLTDDRKYFQLMAFLEEEASLTSQVDFLNQVSAQDYSNRIPTIYGKKLGILTDNSNNPIQSIPAISSLGSLTLTSANTDYIAHLSDSETLETSEILSISPKSSCKRIKQLEGGSQDGKYTINPSGIDGSEYEVYCDMTTEGGGWVLTTYIAAGYDPNYGAISSAYTNGNNYYTDELKIANEYLLDTTKNISELVVDYQYGGLGDYTMNRDYMMKMTAPTSYIGLSLVTNTSGDTYADLASNFNSPSLLSGYTFTSENFPDDIELFSCTTQYTSLNSNHFKMRTTSSVLAFFGFSSCASIQGFFSARLTGPGDTVELYAKDSDTDYEAKSMRFWIR